VRESDPVIRLVAALVFAVVLAALVLSIDGQTWVSVRGPADSDAPEELVLEVGNRAWLGYDGVVSVTTLVPLDVRLVGRDSCRIYAQFSAQPGTRWVIRFAADGSVGVEDWTGRPMDSGPLLPERKPSGCPNSV
jgi:hypothetical protein